MEITRPWWYKLFRSISWACYRYWWLALLLFIAYVILWFIFCFRDPVIECGQPQQIVNNINSISSHLDSCCNCDAVNNQNNIGNIPPGSKPCDYDETMSGGKGYKEIIHQLGDSPGQVVINYDMLGISDQMDVYYDDQLVASTGGLVSYKGNLSFFYPATPGRPTFCKIVMRAPKDGTAWQYHIGCPR